MQLRLMVNNTNELSGGCSALGLFGIEGGTVGSASDNTWRVDDNDGSFAERQLIVSFHDYSFCLETPVPKSVLLNGGNSFMEANEPFKITDGDSLKVGKLSLVAFVDITEEEIKNGEKNGRQWVQRFISVGSLINPRDDEDISSDAFLNQRKLGGPLERMRRKAAEKEAETKDPIHIIETEYKSHTTNETDPVSLFDRDAKAERTAMTEKLGDIIDIEPEKAGRVEIPDDLQPADAFMDMPGVEKKAGDAGKNMQRVLEAPQRLKEIDSYLEHLAESALSAPETDVNKINATVDRDRYLGSVDVMEGSKTPLIDHVLLRPLCAALGLPVQKMSVPQADRLMQDIGAALRAAVSGIVDIYRSATNREGHISETHLHPIEDNPLYLDKKTNAVLEDLFLVRSPVHLSAAAAIEESLKQIRQHQEANETAVDEALTMVLRALDPSALAKRFRRYKGHAPQSADHDAWHWEMYQHYYKEIRSEQQGGLSRMFWEVYRQVYDREMRGKVLES